MLYCGLVMDLLVIGFNRPSVNYNFKMTTHPHQDSPHPAALHYIYANFVPGYNSKREFIVTQGPLHSTRDDFWRMCWETNSRAIVMLTR